MAAPSDLRGMIKRKYGLKEEANNIALEGAKMQADATQYAADRAVDVAALGLAGRGQRQPRLGLGGNSYAGGDPFDNSSHGMQELNPPLVDASRANDLWGAPATGMVHRFAEGTPSVPATGRAILNPVTPPPAPLPAKPVQGPQTLSQIAKGSPAEPFVKGVETIQSTYHTLDGIARMLGFAGGTASVPAVQAQAGLTQVPGSGPSNVDSVPAMLAPKEAVLNAPAANMVGRGLIEALNRIGAQQMGMK